MTTHVVIHPAAEAELNRSAAMQHGLDRIGAQVADQARSAAPKRTGQGAASIDHEVGVDSKGAYVRVTWDEAHFYMLFQEIGSSRMSARPFLRPALDATYTL